MIIRIAHFSDLHSDLTRLAHCLDLKGVDLWVTSGDFFNNSTRGEVKYEVPYQTRWLGLNIDFFKKLFGETPVLVQDGNHDYAPTQQIFAAAGIDARQVHRTKREVVLGAEKKVLTYAGFREINWIAGEWNGETHPTDMAGIVDQVMGENPDLLINHSPPGGILDGAFAHYGIPSLAGQLSYREHTVKANLFGHCHDSAGIKIEDGVIYSNAATTMNIVEIDV
jgi:Icc-related predicted phosphoesterase